MNACVASKRKTGEGRFCPPGGTPQSPAAARITRTAGRYPGTAEPVYALNALKNNSSSKAGQRKTAAGEPSKSAGRINCVQKEAESQEPLFEKVAALDVEVARKLEPLEQNGRS